MSGDQVIAFFLLHVFGDYITQTDWMARNKTKYFWPATVHGLVYTLPFIYFFHLSTLSALVICWSHVLIDRFGLARYLCFAKNWITTPSLRWKDCNYFGYPKDIAPHIAVWLFIIADNFCHLVINYVAIRYL